MLGIILLSIPALILLILLVVLLVPFRYEIEARFRDGKVRAKVCAGWMAGLVRVLFHWKEKLGLLRLKVLTKTVKSKKLGKWPGQEKKKKKKKNGKTGEEEEASPEESGEEEESSPEEAEEAPEETVLSEETVVTGADTAAEEGTEEASGGTVPAEEEKEDTLKKLREKLRKVRAFLEDERNTRAIALILKQLKRIGKHFLPTLFRIEGRLGLGDPARTGRLVGKIYAFYPVYGDSIRLDGVYDRKETDLYLHMKGRIRLGIFVGAALRLLMDRQIRQWIRQLIRKNKDEAEEGETSPEKTEEKAA